MKKVLLMKRDDFFFIKLGLATSCKKPWYTGATCSGESNRIEQPKSQESTFVMLLFSLAKISAN